MNSKYILIAIAAFAVTTSGVHAYVGNKSLTRAGLSEQQILAIETAHKYKKRGKLEEARNTLLEAGITDETLKDVQAVVSDIRAKIIQSLIDDDFEMFKLMVRNTPLGDLVLSTDDFQIFKEAYSHSVSGGLGEAVKLYKDEKKLTSSKLNDKNPHSLLSDSQREALHVARRANDRETMKAILKEAGAE